MSDLYGLDDDWREDDDEDREPDDDWYDDDDYREPDPEDGDIARAYEEHYEHLDTVHGGGECDCRPSLADRLSRRAEDAAYWLRGIRNRMAAATRRPCTLRLGPAEITVRLSAGRACGACGGRGWSYGLDRSRPDERPPGYNTVSLCGCGAAIGQLAETRRYLRSTDKAPPF